ncbi:hypothetical protein EMQ_1121 [Acetobacter aceti NBRC 14818]|uniref:Uncharacterized protein n=2 Tax=Acetobacter aceti TaxID=435 RepID=A0AB33IEJ9_ACEAC|nr:hypothetical protein EMQ_1121 [Acetobacter aceti NBRC 14818]GAN56722.1 hypothetical protein Abac_009_135 [Acetobacter aceti NBRC 14818]
MNFVCKCSDKAIFWYEPNIEAGRVSTMKRLIFLFSICSLVVGSNIALAQEEDGDYGELIRKVTTKTTCLDYLNEEHDNYSGDKMAESRAPDEVTKGLSKSIRDECQKAPKESLKNAVSKVKKTYTSKLSEIMEKVQDDKNALHKEGGV